MVVTLRQQYNAGEKPTVILYTNVNRHAGTPDKKQKQNRKNMYNSTSLNMVVIKYFVVICVAVRRALFEFDTLRFMMPWPVEFPT